MIEIIQIKVGKMDNFLYIIPARASFVVIDPSWGFEKIKEYSLKTSKKLSAVLLTHGHFDHSNDIDKLAKEYGVDIYLSNEDAEFVDFKYDFKSPSDGKELNIDGIRIKVLSTPGHTPGSVCYLYENNIFTGDTLFCKACGRVDLPKSDPEEMRKSLLKLSSLSNDTVVWPGHDYNGFKTTIGEEKENNIFLKMASFRDEFLSIVL
ncbi:MAG TPA: MBL fold metallo-hydrolase [Elusimicrobiales bacterium]|nr:MBL fold metallo-hydrolase [Elusimicrobiales bacterium]HOL63250.1 MBL fold metallo-hydrolase [Elusimicrobiales bacterium]HPO95714.1 MBL fold metallo-hydrolase [Elusimicrobiales bacterium]